MNGDGGEQYKDAESETQAEFGDISIRTPFMRAQHSREDSTGVRVLRWTGEVGLITGTDVVDEDSRMTVGQILTPEQAREIAAGLEAAADEAQQRSEQAAEVEDADTKSILRRLMSRD